MDTENIVFSGNAESLDSWDIDNLKYLRKISVRNPNRKSDFETLSYVSENASFFQECDMLETAIYTSGSDHFTKQQVREDSHLLKRVKSVKECVIKLDRPLPLKRVVTVVSSTTMPSKDENNDEIPPLVRDGSLEPIKKKKSLFDTVTFKINGYGAKTLASEVILQNSIPPNHQSQKQKPLEDCYVMDVLMVRNESVLTESSKNVSISSGKSPELKISIAPDTQVTSQGPFDQNEVSTSTPDSIRKEMTMLRYSSSSPISHSSDDSFASAIEKGFFEMDDTVPLQERNPINFPISPLLTSNANTRGGSSSNSSTNSTIQYVLKSQMRQQPRPDGCPFCGSCTRASSFTYARRREDLQEFQDASLAPTVGGERPPIPMPNTPSPPPPYYVTLRKNLRATTNPNPLNIYKPSNFSLNRNGQLVIDYSSNWEGLESYVKTLTLSTALMRKKSMKSLQSRHST